jgi:hypothetical protein
MRQVVSPKPSAFKQQSREKGQHIAGCGKRMTNRKATDLQVSRVRPDRDVLIASVTDKDKRKTPGDERRGFVGWMADGWDQKLR